jgi:hypothetical protein
VIRNVDNLEGTTTPVPRAGKSESRESFRREVLVSLGATGSEVDALLGYGFSRFAGKAVPPLPLPDEPFVSVWQDYAEEASRRGVVVVLRKKLVQLRFPIRAGISGEEGYRAATLRGNFPGPGEPALEWIDPGGVKLFLHETPVGAIPVLTVRDRRDFITLVRALSMRNEPGAVPESMGAATVTGLNNWDRIARYRLAWEADHAVLAALGGWLAEFARLIPRRERYEDRLIILSEGEYSGVAPPMVGMTDALWREASLVIRREHECFHYFTKRVFGSMNHAIHDELLADYAGIAAAAGRFRADWFLWFMGLENFPRYRDGGRLQNYLGDPQPGAGVFAILQRLVKAAAENVEHFEAGMRAVKGNAVPGRTAMLLAMAALHLEELASADAGKLIAEKLQAPYH